MNIEQRRLCVNSSTVLRINNNTNSPARPPVDHTGAFSYRLVGVVTHYGGTTHSGHYVSNVYSPRRDSWYHYDDSRVRAVDEADVLGGAPKTDGYIFVYLHKDLCNQVTCAESSTMTGQVAP